MQSQKLFTLYFFIYKLMKYERSKNKSKLTFWLLHCICLLFSKSQGVTLCGLIWSSADSATSDHLLFSRSWEATATLVRTDDYHIWKFMIIIEHPL